MLPGTLILLPAIGTSFSGVRSVCRCVEIKWRLVVLPWYESSDLPDDASISADLGVDKQAEQDGNRNPHRKGCGDKRSVCASD